MSAKEKYAQAQVKVRAAREEAQKVMRDAFNEFAHELFASHPEISGFRWKQFTPYFNDGDECVFSVDTDYPDVQINEHHELAKTPGLSKYVEDESWLAGYELETYTGKPARPIDVYLPAWESVKTFLRTFDEDDMRAMYDDHVRVTVTNKGGVVSTEPEEYNHD